MNSNSLPTVKQLVDQSKVIFNCLLVKLDKVLEPKARDFVQELENEGDV